ncbi:hypothetical protein JTB14_018196 [Gonioctena quinquepunctata]|nr:hypothetical protein JTB14_018196 [Gonioctena quinquepunctata]
MFSNIIRCEKMDNSVTRILLLLGYYAVLASSNECSNNDPNICNCYDTTDEYEFQCPPPDGEIIIHAKPDKYIDIDCISSLKEVDLNILPNYTAGSIERLRINYCTWPGNSYNPLLEKFHIEDLKIFELEQVILGKNSFGETLPISKDYFRGLQSLETLTLNKLSNPFKIDAFEELSNLTHLYLEDNKIQEIGCMFDNLGNLKVLHLSRNALTHIPDGLFQNLTKLQQLHLWKNDLTRISKKFFAGLGNLESLELSMNHIQVIDDDSFSDLLELKQISLRQNQLGYLSSRLLANNHNLLSIRFDFNPNLTLEDYAFANMKNLSMLNLSKSGLRVIPEHVFEGSEKMDKLLMENNLIQTLSNGVFSGLKQLKELRLKGNSISHLPDEIFLSLVNLEILDLESNHIKGINNNIFKKLENLKTLVLKNNQIMEITTGAFDNNKNLLVMDLSKNKYEMKNENLFTACKKLNVLLLSENLIEEFPSSLMHLHLKFLILNKNKIRTIKVSDLENKSDNEIKIDLSENIISEVEFSENDRKKIENHDALHNQQTHVNLKNNKLACDCRIYPLVRYIREMQFMVNFTLADTLCDSPQPFQHVMIEKMQPQDVWCTYPKCKCSDKCDCLIAPFNETMVVDCAGRNLTDYPWFEVKINAHKYIELNLNENMISSGPNSTLGYDNVTSLLLSNNQIKQLQWIPPKVKILKLDGNRLRHLDSGVLKMMNSISNLTLSNNNWTCDCTAFDFQNFIRGKFGKESKDIVCADDSKPLIEKLYLCKPITTLILQITIPILVFVIFIVTLVAFYLNYNQEIKIWLYAKNWCRWLFDEEELDRDKEFDIFISYSHHDEDFILQNLLPVLEEGPNPFKTCIHMRDWKPGEYIAKQVTDSVMNSRRTLVVLSNNFLKSVWGKMEFRAAHTQAIEDGRARVIVIKYGDLNEEELDEELKMYLKTNTYVQWGDTWFWRKLRYALPHTQRYDAQKNQKHANMMLKIDDKFKLTSPPPVYPDSTPPVLALDPALLKSHPLNFEHEKFTQIMKMDNFLTRLLFLLGYCTILALSNQCSNSDPNICICYDKPDEYEFQCPPPDGDILILAKPDNTSNRLYIHLKEANLNMFPNYTAGSIKTLRINYCPWPENSFFPLLQKFGIEDLKVFELDE